MINATSNEIFDVFFFFFFRYLEYSLAESVSVEGVRS